MANNNSSNTSITVSSGGIVTSPKQPAFYAYLRTNISGTTGDGTIASLNSGTPYTIVTDQGSNLAAATGIFTAPVAGMYFFSASFQLVGTFTDIIQITTRIVTTARTLQQDFNFIAGTWDDETGVSVNGVVPMAAGNTAYVEYSGNGAATKVLGLTATDGGSYFCGNLVC